MADFEEIKPVDPNDPNLGASSMPHLPPSSMELKVRTMAADIEAMGKGGGLLGLAEKISVSVPQETSPLGKIQAPPEPAVGAKNKTGLYVGLGVAVVALLFAAGYFLPQLLGGKTPIMPEVGNLPEEKPAATTTAPVAPKSFTHVSYFAIPADSFLPAQLTMNTGISFRDQWLNSMRFATTTLTEVLVENLDGNTMSFGDFLYTLAIQFSAKDVFAEDFEPDFTQFAYKDATGYWPGYVLKLKAGGTPLLARADAQKIEKEDAFINAIFPAVTGGPDPAGFKDGQVAGSPVRELSFNAKPAAFVYGWFKNSYLVIGTSEDAVKAAANRL